jgi:sialate O-acetylesterase
MALRGALWYQGENNADDALYLEKKQTMINEWRQLFRDPKLPFYFVQLAAWQPADDNPAGGGWGATREVWPPSDGEICAGVEIDASRVGFVKEN